MARTKRGKLVPPGIVPSAPADGTAGEDAVPAEFEKYLGHFAHLDMPLSAKIELIRTLRAIIQNFVDRAFGDDPTQLSLAARDRDNSHETDADSASP